MVRITRKLETVTLSRPLSQISSEPGIGFYDKHPIYDRRTWATTQISCVVKTKCFSLINKWLEPGSVSCSSCQSRPVNRRCWNLEQLLMTDLCSVSRSEQSLFPSKNSQERTRNKHPSVTFERRSVHITRGFFLTDFRGSEKGNARSLFGVLENVVVKCVLRMAIVFFA